jgi:hypothetical protein
LVERSSFKAEHVSLPSAPVEGTLFTELLPTDDRQRYLDKQEMLGPWVGRLFADAKELVRGAVYMGLPHDEYLKLVMRLHGLHMLRFIPTATVKEVNGLFGVYKDVGDEDAGVPPVIRLIFDGRRANCHFVNPPPVQLPHPCRLAELTLQEGQVLVGGKLDLKDYYHHLRVPDWLVPYLGLPAVSVRELLATGGDALLLQQLETAVQQGLPLDTMVHPALTTLPMGWSHSVYVAQRVHTHLLHSRGALPAVEEISPSRGLSGVTDCHSVYVDDLGVFKVGQAGDAQLVALVNGRLDAAAETMQAEGVPENKKKRSGGSTRLESLGVCVDGDKGLLHATPEKVALLVAATREVIARGWMSPKGMERLVGRWTWVMLLRRPLLSVFSRVYQYIRSKGGKCRRLWGSVARELQLAVDLVPFLFADLRAQASDLVVAVDASEEGLGVVYKRGTSDQVLGSYARGSLPPADGGLPQTPDRPQHLHRSDPRWFSRDWRIAVRGKWRYPLAHISDGEGQAALHALVWLGSRKWARDKRHFLFQDSSVALSGLVKGRSSSPPMLRSLRKSAAVMLACGMWVSPSWVPSADNPADGPSRGVGVWDSGQSSEETGSVK